MNPIATIIIVTTLFSSTMITLLSSHWLTAWIGLEMSTFSIIPILMNKHTPRSTETATKYFLTQATASMLLLSSITYNFILSGQWSMINPTNLTMYNMMILSLLMKLGVFPFHFWVPEVTQGVQIVPAMILLT